LLQIKLARRAAKNKRFNPVRTDRIRLEIKQLKEKVKGIEKVDFDSTVYKLYDDHKFSHWEEQLYDHQIMGYQIMRGRFDHELYVTVDPTIERLLLEEARYRDTIRRGSEYAEVLLVMREHGGYMGRFELKDELLSFGKDWKQSQQLIDELVRMKVLRPTADGGLVLSEELRGKKKKEEKK